jgi:DeoR/GlpR family transcriptional regulator of sugar metabolism
MLAAERITKIIEIVDSKGIVTVKELSSLLNASLMTIRRDLSRLEQRNMIQRTHGGVISMKYNRDTPYMNRSHLDLDEKAEIGKAAAALVEEGEVIFLGSGTTVAQMAAFLMHKVGVTAVTSSFQIINDLIHEQGITLIFLGGIVKSDTYSTVGRTVEKELGTYHFHKAFLGASGIMVDKGVFNSDFLISSEERVVLERAEETYILADHTKFGKSALIHFCRFDQIAGIVTDCEIPEGVARSCQDLGIKLFKAKP